MKPLLIWWSVCGEIGLVLFLHNSPERNYAVGKNLKLHFYY